MLKQIDTIFFIIPMNSIFTIVAIFSSVFVVLCFLCNSCSTIYACLYRPAGRCLQLVRPIGGKAGRNGDYHHHVRWRSGAIRSILELLYGFRHTLFLLQINPIMNVIMMVPNKTLAPKMIHKHHF